MKIMLNEREREEEEENEKEKEAANCEFDSTTKLTVSGWSKQFSYLPLNWLALPAIIGPKC